MNMKIATKYSFFSFRFLWLRMDLVRKQSVHGAANEIIPHHAIPCHTMRYHVCVGNRVHSCISELPDREIVINLVAHIRSVRAAKNIPCDSSKFLNGFWHR